MNKLTRNIAGWGDQWTFCPLCDGDPDCSECGGEGGWPSTARRYDDPDRRSALYSALIERIMP